MYMNSTAGRIVVLALLTSGCGLFGDGKNTGDTDSLLDSDGDTDDDSDDPGQSPPPPIVAGQVTDDEDEPALGVRVTALDETTITDPSGRFVVNEILPVDGEVVFTYRGPGFGAFSQKVDMNNGSPGTGSARLVALTAMGSFDAAALATASIAGFEVEIPAGAMLDSSGLSATGLISLAGAVTDPTTADLLAIPGGSFAEDGTALSGVGVVVFGVAGDGGSLTAVSSTDPLVMRIDIPASLQGEYAAGQTVPWWSFDLGSSVWVEEGTADVVDSGGTLQIEGQATHLSWWGAFQELGEQACLTVSVVDGDGAPVTGVFAEARATTYVAAPVPRAAGADGRIVLPVEVSSGSTHAVEVFLRVGDTVIAHPDNPIETPGAVVANQIPDNCQAIAAPFVLNGSGTVSGTFKVNGAPVEGRLMATTQGQSTHTDDVGRFSMPLFLDVPAVVYTAAYESNEQTATGASPTIELGEISPTNLAPTLDSMTVDGQSVAFEPLP